MGGIGLLIGTGVAAFLIIVGLIAAPGPDKALARLMSTTAVFCCWLMWIIVYMSQMNPLIQPEM